MFAEEKFLPLDEELILGRMIRNPEERYMLDKIPLRWLSAKGREVYALILNNINASDDEIMLKMVNNNLPYEIALKANSEMAITESLYREFYKLHSNRELSMELQRISVEMAQGRLEAEEAQDILFRLFQKIDLSDNIYTSEEAGNSALKLAEEIRSNSDRIIGWPLEKLKKKLNSLMGSELVIIAGRPSMGKTTLMLNLAHMWAVIGYPVGYISLEMGKEDLVFKICQKEVDRSISKNLKVFSEGEMNGLKESIRDLKEESIYFVDSGSFSLPKIVSTIRNMKTRCGIRVLFLDYLQQVEASANTRNDAIGEITRALKQLAMELKVPIIAGSQLNRKLESRENKKPGLSDLRESGSIEQDADVVLGLYRPVYYDAKYENPNDFEIGVLKQRNGETGWDITLNFDTQRQYISD